MSNPYGQQPGYPQQPGGYPSQPGQQGGFPPQQQGGWSQPAQPGGWSQPGQQGYPSSQPAGWPPQQQGGFPPQQPGGWPQQQGFAPGQMAPKKRGSGLIILVVVLVVLVGGGAAGWFLFLSPGHSSSPFFDRHGLPSSVPLPSSVSFDSTQTSTDQTSSGTQWIWLVNGQNAATVGQFYASNLPGKGWSSPKSFPSDNGDVLQISCQGSQVLLIGTTDKSDKITDAQGKERTVVAPSGGSVLELDLGQIKDQATQAILCSGQLPGIPTP